MNQDSIYLVNEGKCYILVEEESVGREKNNLILAIKLAKKEIEIIKNKMNSMDDNSEKYDVLQDELNDHEMLISDFEDRFEDLINRPVK